MVAKEETARIFAFNSLLVVLSPLFSKGVLYKIYQYTLSTHPGTVFIVISVLLFLTFIGQM